MTLQNTDITITHLPNELLECILLKLSYDEISKVRQVCRRFREVGNDILNWQFRKLKNCVESQLAAVMKELNALLGNHMQDASGSTLSPMAELMILHPCRRLLNGISNQIRLLRAVSYRLFFLSDVPPNIRYSRAFFAGKIIDEVHRILRNVRLRRIELEQLDEFALRVLVHKWILFFLHSIEPELIKLICSQNQSTSPDLFGSKVIDLLECFLNCKKDISVNIDSDGWCYIKGEYKLRRSFFTCNSDRDSGLEPLAINEQMNLHEALYILAMTRNQYCLKETHAEEENALHASDITWHVSGSYEGLSVWDEVRYYYSHYSKHAYRKCFQKDNDDEGENRTMDNVQNLYNYVNIPSLQTFRSHDEEDFDLIFKVDMKCRKELAPIELLENPSCGNNEDGIEASVYTVQDLSPDLRLKLEIECRAAERDNIKPPAVYKCLIQQSHSQRGAPVGISEEDVIVSPIRTDRKASAFNGKTVYHIDSY
jgi:hypothetical protein